MACQAAVFGTFRIPLGLRDNYSLSDGRFELGLPSLAFLLDVSGRTRSA
jgi:hypothetical protein